MRRHQRSTAAALLVLSFVIVVWANTRPGFDPYGWLVWGHQTIVGSLDTNAAPSWKPLPYLFTVPFALFGHYQVWLWMIASLAISLSGVVFAGRIAYRLVGAAPERRWAGFVAAAFAGLGVLGLTDGVQGYWHYLLSAQSDPMIVALCLGAIDCHLSGRPRWAFTLGALASLGRPEVWPFLGLYVIWAWRAIPSMRRLIVVGIGLPPGPVVRDSGADFTQPVRRRVQCDGLWPRASQRQDLRNRAPVPRPARRTDSRSSRWRGGVRGVATGSDDHRPGSRRRRLGRARDRIRAPRLAGPAALHVRGGRGDGRDLRPSESGGYSRARPPSPGWPPGAQSRWLS